MAEFTSQVFQNPFLAEGGTDVHAIFSVSCRGAGIAGQTGQGAAGEIVIIDTSGSMGTERMAAAKRAAIAALDAIVDGTYFALVAGNHRPYLIFPPVQSGPGLVIMEPRTRQAAIAAVGTLYADGGTAMGSWLLLARTLFQSVPGLSQRHVLMLTDGENHNESKEQLTEAINACRGVFQADCRGIGTEWRVEQVRQISEALLGSVGVIATPDRLPQDFAQLMSRSMRRGVPQSDLWVWAPVGAEVLFVKQVSPTVEDLAARCYQVNELTRGYATGSWGDEDREYHVAIRLAARELGAEQLAARVQVVVRGQVVTQGLIKAQWSANRALTAQLSPEVAHYTRAAELAKAIQEGLAAKAKGNQALATTRLGQAVQIAHQTGNAEATTRLAKVVEIQDPAQGTVRLKREASVLDDMELDSASTATTRIGKNG